MTVTVANGFKWLLRCPMLSIKNAEARSWIDDVAEELKQVKKLKVWKKLFKAKVH